MIKGIVNLILNKNSKKTANLKSNIEFVDYDFEEYLNYYGGWGDKFGYETGNSQTPTKHVKAIIVDKNTL